MNLLTELPPIRRYKPHRPCFVNKTAIDGIRYPYRVDEVRINGERLLFIASIVVLGLAGKMVRKKFELAPIELKLFRSGRWCVGNDEVNQLLVECEQKVIRKAIRRAKEAACQ